MSGTPLIKADGVPVVGADGLPVLVECAPAGGGCCGPGGVPGLFVEGTWCGSPSGVHPARVVVVPAEWFNELAGLRASGRLPDANRLESNECFYVRVRVPEDPAGVAVCWRFQLVAGPNGEPGGSTLEELRGRHGDRVFPLQVQPWVTDPGFGSGPFGSCCVCEPACTSVPTPWESLFDCGNPGDPHGGEVLCCCRERDTRWTDAGPFRRLFVTGRQILTQAVSGGSSVRTQLISGSVLMRRDGTMAPGESLLFVEYEASPSTGGESRELQRVTFQPEPLCPAVSNVQGGGVGGGSPVAVMYDEIVSQVRFVRCGAGGGDVTGTEVNTCGRYSIAVQLNVPAELGPGGTAYSLRGDMSFSLQEFEAGTPCGGECAAAVGGGGGGGGFPPLVSLNDPVLNLPALGGPAGAP